jgi:hypothetical protein
VPGMIPLDLLVALAPLLVWLVLCALDDEAR